MFVGICKIWLYFPNTNSLKMKRQNLNSLKEKLKNKFNISISEVDFQNYWQRAILGISMINGNKKIIDKTFSNIIFEIEKFGECLISDYEIEFINIGNIHNDDKYFMEKFKGENLTNEEIS